MRKLTLAEWAALGELVAAVAVVISLLLLVYSLERNTAALQGGTENLLFESHTAMASQMVSDPSLVEVRIKVRNGEALTAAETVRWQTYQGLLLDVWAMAYMRHQEDLLSDRHWKAWDSWFTQLFGTSDLRLTEARWEDFVEGFDPEFWAHVRGAILDKGGTLGESR